jgi:hypothetical protein
VTIPVTIKPSAPAGSTVSGTLYVDDASFVLYEFFNGLITHVVSRGAPTSVREALR